VCAIIYEYVYTKAKPSLYELRVAKKLVKGALNLQDLRSLIIFIYIIYLYTILLWFRPPGLKSIYLLWEHHTKCREGGMLFDALLWAVNWWAGSALYISYGCRGLWPPTGGRTRIFRDTKSIAESSYSLPTGEGSWQSNAPPRRHSDTHCHERWHSVSFGATADQRKLMAFSSSRIAKLYQRSICVLQYNLRILRLPT